MPDTVREFATVLSIAFLMFWVLVAIFWDGGGSDFDNAAW